jgi:hypothetical protein
MYGGQAVNGFLKKPRRRGKRQNYLTMPETTTKNLSVVICSLGKLGTCLKSRDEVARPVNTASHLLEALIWGVRMPDIPSWVLGKLIRFL